MAIQLLKALCKINVRKKFKDFSEHTHNILCVFFLKKVVHYRLNQKAPRQGISKEFNFFLFSGQTGNTLTL